MLFHVLQHAKTAAPTLCGSIAPSESRCPVILRASKRQLRRQPRLGELVDPDAAPRKCGLQRSTLLLQHGDACAFPEVPAEWHESLSSTASLKHPDDPVFTPRSPAACAWPSS